MKTKNKLISTHKLFLTRILAVAAFVLLAVLASLIYIFEVEERSSLEKNTLAWANSLAQANVTYLIDDHQDAKKKSNAKLKQLVTPDYINYVHIYKVSNDKTSLFAGFNKNIYYPSIPDNIDRIKDLASLTYEQNRLELIVEIQENKELIGYLYIQSSTKSIDDFNRQLTFTALFLMLLGLTLFSLLAYSIKKKINQPISTLVETVQEISQNKDYEVRIETLPIMDIDILAQNINILLSRTEKHINKKDSLHEQTLLQNNALASKVQARTDALKESNQDLLSTLEKLHQFQGQLVETEKMASLGDMVAGIAHEVNTPIGLGVTASSLMGDQLHEIKQAFEDKTLKSSQLKKFLAQGEENIDIIYRNLERAAKLISSFKKVAVDQSSAATRLFNVKEILEEVFITLKAKLNEKNIQLVIDCPEDLLIESKPGPINQILINLILNSIIHGFENKPEGLINISVIYLSNQLHFTYKDNGIGINDSIKDKVFEPFTTTKRGSGGSGLGLHLVFNLVTQALNGHIDFESSEGLGTTFNMTFPAILVSKQ
jgi:signal transduction histidine kinase